MMNSQNDLKSLLEKIDHRGYPAYKELRGAYSFQGYVLSIDHVQGDPFAAPSKISIILKGQTAGFSKELYDTQEKQTALEDLILRNFGKSIREFSFKAKGSGKSGLMSVSSPGAEILKRSACEIDNTNGDLIIRMEVGFPANGRTVNSKELEKIFFRFIPECVEKSLKAKAYSSKILVETAQLAEDVTYIREQLKEKDMVSFIANGAILPRESGVSSKPMKSAIPFKSPKSLEVEFNLPNKGKITGMGIRKGVTLIVGGGYHGKSTILNAIELGVYDHIKGDGREYCVTEDTAMKIRAEDGRSIKNADISMFINHLPNGKDTVHFSTEDASGSTSQAGNVVEAIEAGAGVLLIDEDTSATNFMVRDELMQRVVSHEKEPITPFVDRIRMLKDDFDISTILVAGSSGSYFYKADTIIQMDEYEPYDITERAKEEAEKYLIGSRKDDSAQALNIETECLKLQFNRFPKADRVCEFGVNANEQSQNRENRDCRERKREGRNSRGQNGGGRSSRGKDNRIKVKTTGLDTISINHDNIDMRYVEQLVDNEQMNTLGQIMAIALKEKFNGDMTLQEQVETIMEEYRLKGFKAFFEGGRVSAGLALVRPQEIHCCINRYRKITL